MLISCAFSIRETKPLKSSKTSTKSISLHYLVLSNENTNQFEASICDCQLKYSVLSSYGVSSYFAIPNHGDAVIFSTKVATNPNLNTKWWNLAFKRCVLK